MQDQPPPNEPRVMLDAEIELRPGHTAPVLAQPSTQRLIVLNSHALNHLEPGRTITVRIPDQEPLRVVVEAIDHSSLILRYGLLSQ